MTDIKSKLILARDQEKKAIEELTAQIMQRRGAIAALEYALQLIEESNAETVPQESKTD